MNDLDYVVSERELFLCLCCSLAVVDNDRTGCEYDHPNLVNGNPHSDILTNLIDSKSRIVLLADDIGLWAIERDDYSEENAFTCDGCGIELLATADPNARELGFRAIEFRSVTE